MDHSRGRAAILALNSHLLLLLTNLAQEERYRYDTFFYVVILDSGKVLDAMSDATETVRMDWFSPTEALQKFARMSLVSVFVNFG